MLARANNSKNGLVWSSLHCIGRTLVRLGWSLDIQTLTDLSSTIGLLASRVLGRVLVVIIPKSFSIDSLGINNLVSSSIVFLDLLDFID